MRLWTAYFLDGHILRQPEDDRYSKHDDNSDWNPSSFRDIQEYPSELVAFSFDTDYTVNLTDGTFTVDMMQFNLEKTPLTDRKLIYYRDMEQSWTDGTPSEPRIIRYAVGYEGKNNKGKVEKKVIYINGSY